MLVEKDYIKYMRKIIFLLIICIFACKTTNYSIWEPIEINEKLSDIEQIRAYTTRNIDYVNDGKEFWQTPIETHSRKAGDCEDI